MTATPHARDVTGKSGISPAYLTKKEAAEYTSLSARSLDFAKARGVLPFYRFSSRRVLFARADLDAWLARMRVDVGAGAAPAEA